MAVLPFCQALKSKRAIPHGVALFDFLGQEQIIPSYTKADPCLTRLTRQPKTRKKGSQAIIDPVADAHSTSHVARQTETQPVGFRQSARFFERQTIC